MIQMFAVLLIYCPRSVPGADRGCPSPRRSMAHDTHRFGGSRRSGPLNPRRRCWTPALVLRLRIRHRGSLGAIRCRNAHRGSSRPTPRSHPGLGCCVQTGTASVENAHSWFRMTRPASRQAACASPSASDLSFVQGYSFSPIKP
jgi:hypothetical protein